VKGWIAVSFTTSPKHRRRFDPERDPRGALRAPARAWATATIVRAVVLAALGIAAAGWGLAYHFTARHAPMLVPAHPPPSATYDADAGELPAPDLEPAP
jgi:hypothetical protein